MKTISKVDTGANPDAILYEPGQQEIYTFNGRGNSATVIEAKTGKIVATVPLSGKPEAAVADPKAGRVYCNIENKNEIAVIDTKTHQVTATWSIAPGEEASGMAFDAEHHRLFIGCHNKLMEMIDSTNGKIVASVPIGDGVDGNAFDPGTQLAFSSNGDGTVTIAHEDAPDNSPWCKRSRRNAARGRLRSIPGRTTFISRPVRGTPSKFWFTAGKRPNYGLGSEFIHEARELDRLPYRSRSTIRSQRQLEPSRIPCPAWTDRKSVV